MAESVQDVYNTAGPHLVQQPAVRTGRVICDRDLNWERRLEQKVDGRIEV